MIINLGSISFNADISSGGGTPAWGTEMGQGEGYKFAFENFEEFMNSKQARQVHLLTKTAVELYDEASAAKGAPRRANRSSGQKAFYASARAGFYLF